MALRGTLTHRKIRTLANLLNVAPCHALGIAEALWHVTAEQAPAGNIGRMSNADIAMEMFYTDDPDKLVDSLIKSRLLDEHAAHRLSVHDWHIHSDDATDNKIARSGETYASGHLPRMRRLSKQEREHLSAHYADPCARQATESHDKPLPEPVPEPDPVPVKISEAKASSPRKDSGKPDPIEAIFLEYPRRVGKKDALKAISRAVQHCAGRGLTTREAQEFLWKQVRAYARSPAGRDGKFTPHPARWFNAGRYDDDQQEWQLKSSERGTNGNGNRPQSRTGLEPGDAEEVIEIFRRIETGEAYAGDGKSLHR